MKAPNLHLNLLREQEILSSSPVRLRVLLPVLAILACVAMVGWWGMLFTQELLLRAQMNTIRADLESKKAQHAEILRRMGEARDLQAEIDQLVMYRNGRRTYGESLAKLAEVMPLRVQLLSLEIPEPPMQDLTPPNARPGAKIPPLLGPTGTVEAVTMRLMGRTPKETPVISLMESLDKPLFTNVLHIVKSTVPAEMSPRIHSFRQEASNGPEGGERLLAFDIEYKCWERRFEK